MSTSITRPMKHQRTLAEKQEGALVAAFRRMKPRERVKLLRAATGKLSLRHNWRG